MIIRIEISNETLQAINDGKYVEGSLRMLEPSNGRKSATYAFRKYNRQARKHQKDVIVRSLEHGWVKESKERIKVYESIPKMLGNARVVDVLARETDDAIEAIENLRIVNQE